MLCKKLLCYFLLITTLLIVTESCTRSPEQNPKINPKPTQDKVSFTVFFGDDQAMYLVPEQRDTEKGTTEMPELMIQELINGPAQEDHTATIPKETKLLSLDIVDEVALVNFSKEIQTKHWGGSTGEIMTMYSIVNTLTQLPEIKSVQFLIEGKKQEAIWGNIETNNPINPDDSLIKK